MRGKNKGKTFVTSRGKRTRQTSSDGDGDSDGLHDHTPSSASESPPCSVSAAVPKQVGTDLSFFQVADDTIETSLLRSLLKCELVVHVSLTLVLITILSRAAVFALAELRLTPAAAVKPMIKQAMFLLEPHVVFRDPLDLQWSELLGTDAAFLNAIIFVAQIYFDLVAGTMPNDIDPSRPAYKHLSKSLRLLQERLSDNARVSDSTTMAILALAGHSTRLGHHKTASGHIKGIRKIVDLRGGVADFKGNPKLLIEIFR